MGKNASIATAVTIGVGIASFLIYKIVDSFNEDTNKYKKIDLNNANDPKVKKIIKEYSMIKLSGQIEVLAKAEGYTKNNYINDEKINFLPSKLLYKILSFCDIKDLCVMKNLNKNLNKFINLMLNDSLYLRNCALKGFDNKYRINYWAILSHMKKDDPELAELYNKYKDLYKLVKIKHSETSSLIEKDITRTFKTHNNKKYNISKLRNLLNIYSFHDKRVGYVQGMNFLVGFIINNFEEYEAFAFLNKVMYDYDVRTLYLNSLPRLRLSIYQFKKLLKKYIPDLYKFLNFLKINTNEVSIEWYLTLFTSSYPDYFVKRVWDLFLIDGWRAIHKIALSILNENKSQIFLCNSDNVVKVIKNLKIKEKDVEGIINGAMLYKISYADLDTYHMNFIDNRLFFD